MSIFESLLNNAGDSTSLDLFIQKNYAQIVAFCSTSVNNQRTELYNFEQFVLIKSGVIENLDYSKSYNRAFVYYLMEYCERFCSMSAIVQLYRIIQDNKLNIGSRLDAAMLYLYNIPYNQVLVDRFEDICGKFQIAINEEDDDDKKAIASFLNYFSYVIYNTSEQFSTALLSKYSDAIQNNTYPFLTNVVIRDCLALDIHNQEGLYNIVQNKIDELLGRINEIAIASTVEDDSLIETDTDYVARLKSASQSFQAIRNISVQLINQYENKDEFYYSLGRGVKILEEEAQLYSYINSYGNMHEAKMLSTLQSLPFNELDGKNIVVYDWGCGQGLASVVLQEYINKYNDVNAMVGSVVLIEPSEIALKRAALHVRYFNGQCQIKTVLKDLDSLQENDLNSDNQTIKIHLFSNILDVEGFSMHHLISIIEQSQRGENYFICASPYITDAKTARIDEFVQYFAEKYDSYQSYLDVENQKGEWKNNWTRVIRVFKVEL